MLRLLRMPRPVALTVAPSALRVAPLNRVIAARIGVVLVAWLPGRRVRVAPLRTSQLSTGSFFSTMACASGPSSLAANAAGTEQVSNSMQAQRCLRVRTLIGLSMVSPELNHAANVEFHNGGSMQ
ncbi:hypothetical protein D3C81_1950180 [compost metagenome]